MVPSTPQRSQPYGATCSRCDAMSSLTLSARGEDAEATGADWVEVIAPSSPAMYADKAGPLEVTVKGYRYTPNGLMYDLEPIARSTLAAVGKVRWSVGAAQLQPINGATQFVRVNSLTGEPQDGAAA